MLPRLQGGEGSLNVAEVVGPKGVVVASAERSSLWVSVSTYGSRSLVVLNLGHLN